MLDKPVVERHLLDPERTVSGLRRLQGVTMEELERSLEKQWAIQHGLQLAILRNWGRISCGKSLPSAKGRIGQRPIARRVLEPIIEVRH